MSETEKEVYEIEKQTKSDYIKCQSCGGNMVFDPESQMLSCPHCGTKISFEQNKKVSEISIETAFSQTEVWSDTAVLKCDNCGASIAVSREEVALTCPYCGTAHVKKTEEICGVKPNAIFPFLITKDSAESLAKKWAKKRFFAPKKFKKELKAEKLNGIYQPCFTFDSQTSTSYTARLGYRKSRQIKTSNGYRTETYVEWHTYKGAINLFFDDVAITASENIRQQVIDRLMPFDYKSICVYEKKYLAGFMANHYDKDVRTSWEEAKSVMSGRIKQAIIKKHNCDEVDYVNMSTAHSDVTYKYILLPIYVLRFRYKDKSYEVDVNGSTGRVVGKSPISPLKVILTVGIALLAVFGLWLLYKSFISSDEISTASAHIARLIAKI